LEEQPLGHDWPPLGVQLELDKACPVGKHA
jgi:hypothetical protein